MDGADVEQHLLQRPSPPQHSLSAPEPPRTTGSHNHVDCPTFVSSVSQPTRTSLPEYFEEDKKGSSRRKSSMGGYFWISSLPEIKPHVHNRQRIFKTLRKPFQSFQLPARRKEYRRLMFKNGETNISGAHIPQRQRHFISDMYTTLVEVKWRYTLILFNCSFLSSWITFAFLWYMISLIHGDLGPSRSNDTKVCVDGLNDWATAFLFSLETQTTIGYGARHVTGNCIEGVMLVSLQSLFGVGFQAFLTGLVFTKLTRPKKRANTLIFSKNAVICKRDGVMTLLFRVGDMRRSHVICSNVRCVMMRKRITKEGEVLALEPFNLEASVNDTGGHLFLAYPATVEHKITPESPFWEVNEFSLQTMQFEVILILEGVVEATGMAFQARTSYIPSEILWGHRFERLMTYQKDNGKYKLDFEKFHKVLRIDNFPQCSAKHMNEVGEENMTEKGIILDDYDPDLTQHDDMQMGKMERPHELTVTFEHGSGETPENSPTV